MEPESAPRECILVVDDQAANIQTVGSLLSSMAYDVMAATSADQALQRMTARTPDLILLDMMMPGVSGLDLCRRLQSRRHWEDIPVIFLSAAGEVGTVTAGLEAGAVDYVTKPFHRAELLLRIRTHLALKSARQQLRRTAAEKDELFNLLAHDFKNHLAAIQVHADFLKSLQDLPSGAAACVSTISSESARMAGCVNALLSSNTSSVPSLTIQSISAAGVATEAAAAAEPLAKAKSQTLLFHRPSPALQVLADRDALRRILDNLLGNAVKFTPPGGSIELGVTASDGSVEFTVTDTGPGFTGEDRRRAFQRFARLSAQPTGGESSSGLGLSIVRALTVAMHGEVWISGAAAGACCTVRLPRGPA